MWGPRDRAGPAPRSLASELPIREPARTTLDAATPRAPAAEAEARFDATGDRQRLPVASVLAGTYRLDRVLGAGGMATVFAATHLRNANRVAVKVLHPGLVDNPEIRTRFLREGYAANSVRHAGTVRVLDDGVADDGALFLVMELLDGETLDALWERRGRRLPAGEVAHLMCQLLDVLSAAHERGIVHRDIKPENIFVERNGTLRILDFGVARLLEGTLAETRSGSVIGTLPYMAPEQILGKTHDVDARADVWSVGATAFTLVSGRFVHEAETPEEMMVFTGSRQAPSLASVAPQAPRAFAEVVDRALRFDKRERWPSAGAMHRALRPTSDVQSSDCEPSASGRLVSVADASPRRRMSSRRWARRTAAFVVGVAALALAAAAWPRPLDAQSATGVRSRAIVGPPVTAVLAAGSIPSHPIVTASAAAAPTAVVVVTAKDPAPALHDPVWPQEPETRNVTPATASPRTTASPTSSPQGGPGAAAATPNDCTPPFTILPVTGKKRWKRECL